MRVLQQTQAGRNAPAAPAPAQQHAPAQAQSGVPADLGEQINRIVNDAVTAATQGATSAEKSRQARDEVRKAMDQLRAELAARQVGARPAVVQVPPILPSDVIPPQAVTISIAFFAMIAFIVVGLPLARAFARRMDRKGQAAELPPELAPRLDRIEQAVEAVAIEVERVSEGQRFSTKVLAELRGLPSPNSMEARPGRGAAAVPVAPAGERGR